MPVGHKLSGFGQLLKRFDFKYSLIPGDQINYTWLKDEVAAIDPSCVARRLFNKASNLGTF